MQEIIELRNPVLIDNEQVHVLTYDIDKVTPNQFIEAEILAANVATSMRKVSTKVVELDAGFHYYLGVMAIIADNPEYSVEDIGRITGPDVKSVMQVGRNFMIADVEEDEDEDSASIEPEDEDEDEDNRPSYLPTLE